jgi:hypothetical protein
MQIAQQKKLRCSHQSNESSAEKPITPMMSDGFCLLTTKDVMDHKLWTPPTPFRQEKSWSKMASATHKYRTIKSMSDRGARQR